MREHVWLRGGNYCLFPRIVEAHMEGLMAAARRETGYFIGYEAQGFVCRRGVIRSSAFLIMATCNPIGIAVYAQTYPDGSFYSAHHAFPMLLEDAVWFIRKHVTKQEWIHNLFAGERTWRRFWELREWLHWKWLGWEWEKDGPGRPDRCLYADIPCKGCAYVERMEGSR